MHHHRNLLFAALLSAPLAAQSPVDPPPWWGVVDDVTVSLAWTFDNPATFLQPTTQVVPSWYQPSVTRFANSPNVVHLPAFAGRTGVLAVTGSATPNSGTIALTVDNDPHLDWVKWFWFQYDEFEGASGSVSAAIRQDLAKYKRANVTEKVEPLANGWQRVTISAQLIPQPDDEAIDWTLTAGALATAAIDNLFVNSKCLKPGPDDADEALGDPDGFPIDLGAATGAQCLAAAVTEGPAPGNVRTYWVAGIAASANQAHPVFRLDQNGTVIGSPITVGPTLAQAPFGPSDLAVETLRGPGGARQIVYAIYDRRPGGSVLIQALDAGTGTPDAQRTVTILNFPPIAPQPLGLAFYPPGNGGQGTFWVTDQQGNAYQFDRQGNLVSTLGGPLSGIPLGVTGAGYDASYGNFYWWSSAPVATPTPGRFVQVNGYEQSAYDLQPTGVRFCGNLQLPNPGGPAGGVAAGFEVYRRANGRLRFVCVAQLGNRSVLYELHGPFRFGFNLLGRCGMRGGVPFEGNPNFQITLTGVPNATFAALYIGFSNTTYSGQNLPFSLSPFGMPESNLSVALHMESGLLPPQAPGSFAFTLPLPPPGTGFSYVPIYCQWVVFDPSAPGGLATSQAGKTVVY